jgi:hypothetical protein
MSSTTASIAVRSHRTLSYVLYAISAIEGLAGLVLIFASGWVMTIVPIGATLYIPGFILALLKALGIVALALGYLLCVAARDPVRYVAIIDAFIFLAVAAAVLEFYGIAALQLGTYYPLGYIVARAILQLILAVALFALRPKEAPKASSG